MVNSKTPSSPRFRILFSLSTPLDLRFQSFPFISYFPHTDPRFKHRFPWCFFFFILRNTFPDGGLNHSLHLLWIEAKQLPFHIRVDFCLFVSVFAWVFWSYCSFTLFQMVNWWWLPKTFKFWKLIKENPPLCPSPSPIYPFILFSRA